MEEVRNVRPVRKRKLPTRYRDEECLAVNSLTANIDEPESVKEALSGEMSKNWEEAMNNENKSLLTNGTWDLVPLPKGANVLGSRWVFKVKRDEDGEVDRFKARLVAQEYTQKKGVDNEEVFSPVARHASLRTLLTCISQCI